MIFLVLMAISLIITLYLCCIRNKCERIFAGAIALIGTAFVGLVLAGVITIITIFTASDPEYVTTRSTPIVSLNDGSGSSSSIHGSFFLGIGSVSGEGHTYLAYTWYQRNSNGSLSGKQVLENDWNNVGIFEVEDVRPHIVEYSGYTRRVTPSWLFPFDLHDKAKLANFYAIYVPKGTVVHGYTLNGE